MRHILRGIPLFVLPAVLTISAAGCVDITAGEARFIDTVERRFTVTGAPALDISTFDGSVDVGTWDRPEVLVVIEKHAVDKAATARSSPPIRTATSSASRCAKNGTAACT